MIVIQDGPKKTDITAEAFIVAILDCLPPPMFAQVIAKAVKIAGTQPHLSLQMGRIIAPNGGPPGAVSQ